MISSWQYGEGWSEDLPRKSWLPLWLEARIVRGREPAPALAAKLRRWLEGSG